MDMDPPHPPGGNGSAGKKDSDNETGRRRGQQQQQSMDVFGGTEGQAVVAIAVLMYVVQQLTTWASSNCAC
jgi:hypothetical protein